MLISFAVTAKLICVFVLAYADCWFSHEAAHLVATLLISPAVCFYCSTIFACMKCKPRSVLLHCGDNMKVNPNQFHGLSWGPYGSMPYKCLLAFSALVKAVEIVISNCNQL